MKRETDAINGVETWELVLGLKVDGPINEEAFKGRSRYRLLQLVIPTKWQWLRPEGIITSKINKS